jgi:hypothetical protein
MNTVIEVTSLPGYSVENGQPLDKKRYRVVVSDGTRRVTVEARLDLGMVEMLADEPEESIRKYFATKPLPEDGSVFDVL